MVTRRRRTKARVAAINEANSCGEIKRKVRTYLFSEKRVYLVMTMKVRCRQARKVRCRQKVVSADDLGFMIRMLSGLGGNAWWAGRAT